MNLYKIGKVVSIGKTYIILETNSEGFIVNVANPSCWIKEDNKKVYIYQYKTEYTQAIYGFITFKERIVFEDLISISGIGPKTALNILKDGEDLPISLISQGDIKSLSNMPQLGIKTANQIVFELQEKYKNIFKSKLESKKYVPSDIKENLKLLGFKSSQIDYAISKISSEDSLEHMVEDAIKVISSAKFS